MSTGARVGALPITWGYGIPSPDGKILYVWDSSDRVLEVHDLTGFHE